MTGLSATSVARRLALVLFGAAVPLLGGCGDSGPARPGADSASRDAPRAKPFAPRPGATLADARTALVLGIDRLRPDDLDAPGLVHLPRLVAGSHRFRVGLCASTAGNAALASVLTGLEPPEHGVRSVHERGRTRLAEDLDTFPEVLARDGWRTVASVGARREARGIGGFDQGFAAFDDPRGAELARSADQVMLGFEDALDGAFDGDERVAGLLTFADLTREVRPDFTDARVPAIVRRHLTPFAKSSRELAELLTGLDSSPVATGAALDKRYGRMREAGVALAWRAAQREIQLLTIDDAVGRVLGLLEASGRAEDALVCVLGLRGDVVDPRRDGAPRIPRELVEVPFFVRLSGSVGACDVPGAAETRALAGWIARALTGDRDATPEELVAADAARAFGAAGTTVAVQAPDGSQFEVDLGGERAQVEGGVLARPHTDAGGAEPAFDGAARDALPVLRIAAVAGVEARWKVAEGRAFEGGAARFRPGQSGSFRFDESAGARGLYVEDRTAATRLELRAEGLSAQDVWLAGESPAFAARAPVAWVPVADPPATGPPVPLGEEATDAPPAQVLFEQESGARWTLRILGEGPAEVLVSVWPPRDARERLEVLLGAGVRQRDVPGRRDLVHLVGELPMDAVLEKVGGEMFTVVCATEAGFVGPDKISIDGRRYGAPGRLAFIVPAWQPAVSERIGDGLGVLARGMLLAPVPLEFPPNARVVLVREERGPLPGARSGIPSELRRLMSRLSRGE